MNVSNSVSAKQAKDWICLLLPNTVENRNADPIQDYLTDLKLWASLLEERGVLDSDEMAQWVELAAVNPGRASEVLADAKVLREAMFRVFSTVAEGGQPEPADMDLLNDRIADVYSHLEVSLDSAQPQWRWRDAEGKLEALFWPAIHSAGQLLTSDELGRLRNCNGDKCTWLFMDRSKNRSRRWCTMDVCGNRAKSKRHYAKVRNG